MPVFWAAITTLRFLKRKKKKAERPGYKPGPDVFPCKGGGCHWKIVPILLAWSPWEDTDILRSQAFSAPGGHWVSLLRICKDIFSPPEFSLTLENPDIYV